jgi:hypothetical protein
MVGNDGEPGAVSTLFAAFVVICAGAACKSSQDRARKSGPAPKPEQSAAAQPEAEPDSEAVALLKGLPSPTRGEVVESDRPNVFQIGKLASGGLLTVVEGCINGARKKDPLIPRTRTVRKLAATLHAASRW